MLWVTFSESRLGHGSGAAGLLGRPRRRGGAAARSTSAGLIGRSRLVPYLVASALLTTIPYLVLTGIDMLLPAVVLFLALGAGERLQSVATGVGIQRSAPDRVVARRFGVSEGLRGWR